MRSLAVLSLTLTFVAQTDSLSPRELLRAARPLTSNEIAAVLGASRDALSGKTLRLSASPVYAGTEVLMSRAGRPKRVRFAGSLIGGSVGPAQPGSGSAISQTRWREDRLTIVDYTELPARRCGGALEQGEMVVEYTHTSTTGKWTVSARRRADREWGGPGMTQVFEMLQGAVTVTSGEHREIRGRRARAFVAPWTPTPTYHPPPERTLLTGDPMPNAAGEPRRQTETEATTQWLWIDAESLLPLRWDLFGSNRHDINVEYERFDLAPPAGLDRPHCIP